MLLIAENIPATSETVPLIVIYLTTVMSLTSISIILTVLISRLHHANNESLEISRRTYGFMTKKVAIIVGMSNTVKRYEEQMSLSLLKNRQNKIVTSSPGPKRQKPNGSPSNSNGIVCEKSKSKLNDRFLKANLNEVKGREKMVQFYSLRRPSVSNINIISEGSQSKKVLKGINKLRSDVKYLISKESNFEYTRISDEWKLVGLIVDRVLFWSFFFMIFVSTTGLLIVIPVLKNREFI